jgi:hypothetical protein
MLALFAAVAGGLPVMAAGPAGGQIFPVDIIINRGKLFPG